MRVGLNLINSNASPRGCDRYALELVLALSRLYPRDQLILFRAPWQTYLSPAESGNVEAVVLDAPRGLLARALWQKHRFPVQARMRGVDLVHYTNPMPLACTPLPAVVTIHDLAEFSQPRKYGWMRSAGKRWFVKRAVARATQLIVVSETTRQELMRYTSASPHRIAVTPEGVSVPSELPGDCRSVLARYALPERFLLFVGVIERTKQVEQIVYAFARIHHELRSGTALVIAGGPGNGQRELESAIQACGLAKEVKVLGHVPDDVLWCLYRSAQAFVFPSLVEGFGLPVVEALATGTPVITTDIPIMREVAGEAALLVPPNSTERLAEAMARMLSDPGLRATLAEQGRRRSAHYRWEHTARLTRSVYASAMENGR